MRSAIGLVGFMGALCLLGLPPAEGAWTAGDIFVYDNVWADSDVLQYDANGNFIRSLKAGLPVPGTILNSYGHLRWGPDGDLYLYCEVQQPLWAPDWRKGVLHWASDGSLVSFDEFASSDYITGFTVLDNGNWLIVGSDGTSAFSREYSRDFSTCTEFAVSGHEGAAMHDGLAYVAANHYVQVLDPVTHAGVTTYTTAEDNNDIAVAPGGDIAVNYQ